MYERAILEAMAVGKTDGVTFADDYLKQQLAFADNLNPGMKASMANDLEAGRRLEAPWLSGAVATLAKGAGVAAPVSSVLYAAVKPYLAGAPRPA